MGERLGLRVRFLLFFAALFAGGLAAIGAGLWVGYSRGGGVIDGYVIAGLIGALGLLGATAWVALLFDENVAKPILEIASDLHTRANAEVDAEMNLSAARHLGSLAPAADAINRSLTEMRDAQERVIERETDRLNREKALFEALLRDLAEGVIVATMDHRVMLYNRVAQAMLGNLGLDRPLTGFLRPEPLGHALDRLSAKLSRGQVALESFLAATADGERFLLARVGPVLRDEEQIGYVLIFHDATEDMVAHADRDHLFNELLEGARRPAAAIGTVLGLLQADAEMDPELRVTFNASMQEEIDRLIGCLQEMAARNEAILTRHWPMSDVSSDDIFDGLKARGIAPLEVRGEPHFLSCDGFAVLEILASVISGLAESGTREGLTLAAEPRDGEIWLAVGWRGEEVPDGLLDQWLKEPLSESYGRYSGRDALAGHRTDMWSEVTADGHRIVLPLNTAEAPELAPADARPEFYDFNLPSADAAGDLADRPLSELRFVVFDTETTGLSPRGGDEIVQIAGVRIVNGRILRGEIFDTLVNPGRRIPEASTAVHKIDDSMVVDAPDIVEAGRKFHEFCEGSVLVAHNAPFDLAFLRLKQEVIGRKFDQPALCTVLLSASLFSHTGQHTLDALVDRFGVELPTELRHTALGDAVATAEVFRQMLDVMASAGITTLGEAIAASREMTKIRKAQNY